MIVRKFPRVLGIEGVGIIENDPVGEFEQGQKVAAFMGGMGRDFEGSYSEYVIVPRNILMTFESNLPWDVRCTSRNVPNSLWVILFRDNPRV